MSKKTCVICKIAGIFAVIGALNWGWIGLTGNNLVAGILGEGSGLTKIVYILVGISGLALLAGLFNVCPKCKE